MLRCALRQAIEGLIGGFVRFIDLLHEAGDFTMVFVFIHEWFHPSFLSLISCTRNKRSISSLRFLLLRVPVQLSVSLCLIPPAIKWLPLSLFSHWSPALQQVCAPGIRWHQSVSPTLLRSYPAGQVRRKEKGCHYISPVNGRMT